jgi:drug/metabolite transporter (DMT)-like permease
MLLSPWLWAVSTVFAAGAQTLRNAFQRDLVDKIGAANATFVRFLFGAPFALAFLPLAHYFTGAATPAPGPHAALYIALGAATQIFGTALMLLAMKTRSFVVVTALMKTEPALLVVFGALIFGEHMGFAGVAGVFVATLGVLLASLPRGAPLTQDGRAVAFGLASAAAFGLSTVAFRAGVLALGGGSAFLAAAAEVAYALGLQTLCILAFLGAVDRGGLRAILREWRGSMLAGFLGAAATLLWFLALALESAARVRALGLVEILVAFAISRRFFAQKTTAREALGLAAIVVGVALVLLCAS